MTKTKTNDKPKPTFTRYVDGIYDTIIRASDGAGIVDLHAAGECPRACPICNDKAVQ
jgi:hypothetical protein